ncbi:Divalent-cation tolerance protein CutA [Gammaproteobacteria bacterium]
MTTDTIVVLCTCPDADTAQTLATTLVARRLAACVNLLPGITSIYRWQGAVESADEHLLVIKTRAPLYPALETALTELHPYEVPEVIALPIVQGLPAYLNWVTEEIPASGEGS